MSDPANLTAIDDVKFNTGHTVEPVVASDQALKQAIERYYDQSVKYEEIPTTSWMLMSMSSNRKKSAISSTWSAQAKRRPSFDRQLDLVDAIKRSPLIFTLSRTKKSFRVRYRIDGALRDHESAAQAENAITSRVKIMANLDIAECRLPQDGRIKIKMGGGREMDFRVSVLPTLLARKSFYVCWISRTYSSI